MRGKGNHHLLAFNAGEFSDRVELRKDLEKYASAALKMENCDINKQGEMYKRAGTRFIAECKSGAVTPRLLPFEFSTTTAFVLEFGNLYVRFYSNEQQVMSGGSPYEVATPWPTAALYGLHYRQINDVIYITHPDYAPRKLTRLADTNWTLEVVDWEPPAMLDQNFTDISITPSGTTGTITLTASVPSGSTTSPAIFESGHVGSRWIISQEREASVVEIPLGSGSTTSTTTTIGPINKGNFISNLNLRRQISSSPVAAAVETRQSAQLRLVGEWTVRTRGFWGGTLYLEKKRVGDLSWKVIRAFRGNNDRNVEAVPVEGGDPVAAEYRLRFVQDSGWTLPDGGSAGYATLESTNEFVDGLVEITAVGTGGTTATATVIKDLDSTDATTYWSEPIWSDHRGWPTTLETFEDRLWLAGNAFRPLNFQGSQTSDFENFSYGFAAATDAISNRISARKQNPIRWMSSLSGLILASDDEIWDYSTAEGDAIEPANGRVRRQSSIGADRMQPINVEDVLIFVHADTKRVYELSADDTAFLRSYLPVDLTDLADHVTRSGITQIDILTEPETRIFAVTKAGHLGVLLYARHHNVVGWTRYVTDGAFESVAVSGNRVWCVVRRTINGATKRYVELLENQEWATVAREDNWFVDCGKTVDLSGLTNISNVTNADPAVITASASFTQGNDDMVRITGTGTELDNEVVTIKNKAGNTFEAYDETGTNPVDLRLSVSATVTNSPVTTNGSAVTLAFASPHGASTGDNVTISGITFRDWSSGSAVNVSSITVPITAVPSTTEMTVLPSQLTPPGSASPELYAWNGVTVTYGTGNTAYVSGGQFESVATELTGFAHLAGKTVQILGDGGLQPDAVVTGLGVVPTQTPVTKAQVGLGYTMSYQSMRLDLTQELGMIAGKERRVCEMIVSVQASGTFEYSTDGTEWYAETGPNTAEYGGAPVNFTADVRLSTYGQYDLTGYIYLRQPNPLPLKVKAVTIKYESTGR